MPSSELSTDDSEDERIEELAIEHPFDSKSTICVPDLRTLSQLPVDSESDGTFTFRALLFPKDKTVHVPNEPGCYATVGPWRQQNAVCLVHFAASTKRPKELLLAFVSMGLLNTNMTGTMVMSLTLPLLKKRNVYEQTPRFTKIVDVVGFSSIDEKAQPWCTMLKPALERQPMYEDLKVYSQSNISGWLRAPLSTRIETLETRARVEIVALVAGYARQDKAGSERRKATLTAGLDQALAHLWAMPPPKYDRAMTERVLVLSDVTPPTAAWLKTPVRKSMEEGSAECRPTALAARREAFPASAPTAAAAAAAADDDAEPEPEPAAADPATAAAPDLSDADAFLANEAALKAAEAPAPAAKKRERRPVNRHVPVPAAAKPASAPSKRV